MASTLVIPRLEGGTSRSDVASNEGPLMVDPPGVTAIRMAFGVGGRPDDAPSTASFRTTYQVSLPVFSIGGLDPDGVYEFDAALLMDTIVRRSLRRRWGMRLELELSQTADTVSKADIYIEAPSEEAMEILGKTGRGTTMPGGGRTLVIATPPVHDHKRVQSLSGIYSIQLRDTSPDGAKPHVLSLARGINVDLTRFEFEG